MAGDHLDPVVAKLSADLSDFNRGMAQARAEMSNTADSGGRSFSMLQTAGTLAFTALGAAAVGAGAVLAGVGAYGLKAAADMEQVQVAFEGLMGNKAQAEAFLDSLQAFANRTPFEFTDLQEAAKQLMATGTAADQVIPVMTTIGNVASNLGVGAEGINSVVRALGQMQGKGKASAEELQQISEALPGFSAIGAIADSMGISVAEAFDKMATGGIPASEAIEAILAGMERMPGAAGAMERQAATLTGVLSTMKDTLKTNLVEGLMGVVPAIKDALSGAQEEIGNAVSGVASTLGGLIPPLLGLLEPVLNIASGVLGSFGAIFTSIATQLQGVFAALGPVAQPFFDMLASLGTTLVNALGPVITSLLPPIVHLVTVIGNALTPVINALAPIVQRVAEAFGQIITKLADSGVFERLSEIFVKLLDALAPIGAQLMDVLLKAFEELQPAIPPLLDLLEAFIPVLVPMAESWVAMLTATAPLIPIFTQLVIILAEVLTAIAPVAAKVSEFTNGLITGAIETFVGLIRDLAKWFKDLGPEASAAWQAVQSAVSSALPVVQPLIDVFKGAVDGVSSAMGWLLDNAPAAWSAVQGAVSAAMDVAQPLVDVFSSVLGAVVGATTWLLDHAGEAWGIVQGAVQAAMDVAQPLVDAFSAVMGAIIGATGWLIDHAGPAWDALSGAVSGAFSTVYDAMLVPLRVVIEAISTALGVIAYVAGVAWGAVKDGISTAWGVIEGPLNLMKGALEGIGSALGTIVGTARDAKRALENLTDVKLPGGGGGGFFGSGVGPDVGPELKPWWMDTGGIIPGPTGAPRPIIAHGDEVIVNASQQANLLWAIAQGQGGVGGGGGVTVVIVRDLDEAREYIPDGAWPDVQSAFLSMRR